MKFYFLLTFKKLKCLFYKNCQFSFETFSIDEESSSNSTCGASKILHLISEKEIIHCLHCLFNFGTSLYIKSLEVSIK